MKPELKNQLLSKYPKLFSHNQEIYCGDGWYNLIDILCNLLQGYANRNSTESTAQMQFSQIKEKFGVLNIYYKNTNVHEYVLGITTFAEKVSHTVCEITGEKGSLCRMPTGFVKTLAPGVAEVMLATPIVRSSNVADVLATPNAEIKGTDE